MKPINAYFSFKRVTKVPLRTTVLASGRLTNGASFAIGVHEDPVNPALYVMFDTVDGDERMVRVDLARFVETVAGAEARDEDRWEPLVEDESKPGVWGNSQLTAFVTTSPDGNMKHIDYHWRDRAPIRDWRVGQRIKNQLAGPDWEGVELYPAEDRLVDAANSYHIWCFNDRLPIGFADRLVGTQEQIDATPSIGGAVQRDDPGQDASTFDADRVKRAMEEHLD